MSLKVGDWVRHTVEEDNCDAFLRVERITDEFIFYHDGTHSDVEDGTDWLEKLEREGQA